MFEALMPIVCNTFEFLCLRLLSLLLENSKETPNVDKCCLEGNTPLAVAVSSDGHVAHVRRLIAAGCDVNIPDFRNRRTALQVSCKDDFDILRYMSKTNDQIILKIQKVITPKLLLTF